MCLVKQVIISKIIKNCIMVIFECKPNNLPDGSREAAIKVFEHERKLNDACSGMMEHFLHVANFLKYIN